MQNTPLLKTDTERALNELAGDAMTLIVEVLMHPVMRALAKNPEVRAINRRAQELCVRGAALVGENEEAN